MTRSALQALALSSSLALIAGCGSGDAGSDVDTQADATDLDAPELGPAYAAAGTCVAGATRTYDIAGGVAVAVQPSATDAGILDADPAGSGDGYGWHAVAYPSSGVPTKTIVWLQGSKGTPYSTSSCKLKSQNLLEEATAKGYLVLQIAHANPVAVGSLCWQDPDCYGPVRNEIVTGTDASALVSVDAVNGIEGRLKKLVAHVKAYPASFPGLTLTPALAGATIDYASIRFGGHSQGGGHAGLIAKNVAVQQACFVASIVDSYEDALGATLAATWTGSGSWVTPTSRVRSLYHASDDWAPGIEANNAAIGVTLVREKTYCPPAGCVSNDPHGAILSEARYASDRAWACFN